MERSAAHFGTWLCILLLLSNLVLLILQDDGLVVQKQLSEQAEPSSVLAVGFLPVDIKAIEADLELLDRQEYEVSEQLQDLQDDVRRECLKEDMRSINSLLRNCGSKLDELGQELKYRMPDSSWPWLKELNQKFNARTSAIGNLKEELLRLEFQCEEMDAMVEEGDAEQVRQESLHRLSRTPRPHRRPSSLPDRLA